jgi:uncharacterized protein YegL
MIRTRIKAIKNPLKNLMRALFQDKLAVKVRSSSEYSVIEFVFLFDFYWRKFLNKFTTQ